MRGRSSSMELVHRSACRRSSCSRSTKTTCSLRLGIRSSSSSCCAEDRARQKHVVVVSGHMRSASSDEAWHRINNGRTTRLIDASDYHVSSDSSVPVPSTGSMTGISRSSGDTGKAWVSAQAACCHVTSVDPRAPAAALRPRQTPPGKQQHRRRQRRSSPQQQPAALLLAAAALSAVDTPALSALWKTDLPRDPDGLTRAGGHGGTAEAAGGAVCASATTETAGTKAVLSSATAAAAVKPLHAAPPSPLPSAGVATFDGHLNPCGVRSAEATVAAAGRTGRARYALCVEDSSKTTKMPQAGNLLGVPATTCSTSGRSGDDGNLRHVVSSEIATRRGQTYRSSSIRRGTSVCLPTRGYTLHSSRANTWRRSRSAISSSEGAVSGARSSGAGPAGSSSSSGFGPSDSTGSATTTTNCCSCGTRASGSGSGTPNGNISGSRTSHSSSSGDLSSCSCSRATRSGYDRLTRNDDLSSSNIGTDSSRTTVVNDGGVGSGCSCLLYNDSSTCNGETDGGVHHSSRESGEARFYQSGKMQSSGSWRCNSGMQQRRCSGDSSSSDTSSSGIASSAAARAGRSSGVWGRTSYRMQRITTSSDAPSGGPPYARKQNQTSAEGASHRRTENTAASHEGACAGEEAVSFFGSSAVLFWLQEAARALWGLLKARDKPKFGTGSAWMKDSPLLPMSALLLTILASQLLCDRRGFSSFSGPAASSSAWLSFNSPHLFPLAAHLSPSAATAGRTARDMSAGGKAAPDPSDDVKTDLPRFRSTAPSVRGARGSGPTTVRQRHENTWPKQQQQVSGQLHQARAWEKRHPDMRRRRRPRDLLFAKMGLAGGEGEKMVMEEELRYSASRAFPSSPRSSVATAATKAGLERRRLDSDPPNPSVMQVPIASTLAFFCFLFFSAVFLQWLVSKIPSYPPPVSIVWFVFGMLVYGIASAPSLLPRQEQSPQNPQNPTGIGDVPLKGHNILQTGILEMRVIDSNVVYFVMVPILLYEATQNINWHKFKRFLAGGLTLAVLGVALQVGLLGVLFYFTYMKKYVPATENGQDPWTAAFLLASTLSSTDPVAVLSVLNAVNASDKLCIMFDGESLINDGSAVLLFQFFFFLLRGVTESPASTFFMFVKLLFAGPAFGCVLGFAVYVWLNCFRKFPMTQCLAVVTVCYTGYFVAEAVFSLSGPLTAVCYGLFIKSYGHIALDREAQLKHHTLVEGLALMGNCAIFIISGIVTYGMMSSVFIRSDGGGFWLNLFLTYLYLNLARVAMIVFFSPILRRTGYGLTWKEAVLLIWGGLRGGIVLALGLRIERDGNLESELTKAMSFFISGSVFLILLIHGMTFELLYRGLSPYPPKPFRRVYLEAVMKMIDYQYMEEKQALKNHWLFKGTDVLVFADKVVPALGWRKVDRMGNMNLKAPDITLAFSCLHEASLTTWVVPTAYTMAPSVSVMKRLDTAGIRMQQQHELEGSSREGSFYEGEERNGEESGGERILLSPPAQAEYETAVAAAAELRRQQEAATKPAQPLAAVPSRSRALLSPPLPGRPHPAVAAAGISQEGLAARSATGAAATAGVAAGELSPESDFDAGSALHGGAAAATAASRQQGSPAAEERPGRRPVAPPLTSPPSPSGAAAAAGTPASSRLHVSAQPLGTEAAAADAPGGGVGLGLRSQHHPHPAPEGAGVAVAADGAAAEAAAAGKTRRSGAGGVAAGAEATSGASPLLSPAEAQKQHDAGATPGSAAYLSPRPSFASRPVSEVGSRGPSRTPSLAATHVATQQRLPSHLQPQQQHGPHQQPHSSLRDHPLTPRRPGGRLHDKEEETVETHMKKIRKEKHAHTLAALSQGLKPELPSATSAFDPKFNLRLIEHATTEDKTAAVPHQQQRGPHLSAPSFGASRGAEGGGPGGGGTGRRTRLSREQLQQQYHYAGNHQRSTGRVEAAAAAPQRPESHAGSGGGEPTGEQLLCPASSVSCGEEEGQHQQQQRRQFFPSPSGGSGSRAFLARGGGRKQHQYLAHENTRGSLAAAGCGGSSSSHRLLSVKSGVLPADGALPSAAGLREAETPASSCTAVEHAAASAALSSSAPGSSAAGGGRTSGGAASRHSWTTGLLQAMGLVRSAAAAGSARPGERPEDHSQPKSERSLLLDVSNVAAAGTGGSKPRRSRSRGMDSTAAAAAGAIPYSVTALPKNGEAKKTWRTARSGSSRRSLSLVIVKQAETVGEAAAAKGGGGAGTAVAAGADGRDSAESMRRGMHASVAHAAAYECEWDEDCHGKTRTVPALAAAAGGRSTSLVRGNMRRHGKKRLPAALLLTQAQGRQLRVERESKVGHNSGDAAAFAENPRLSSKDSLHREGGGGVGGAAKAAEHSEDEAAGDWPPPVREDSARRYDTDATLVFHTKGFTDQAEAYRRKRKNRLAYRFHDLLHFPSLHRSRRASSESSSVERTGSDRSGGGRAGGGGGPGPTAGGGGTAERGRGELPEVESGDDSNVVLQNMKCQTSSEVLKGESSTSPRRGRVMGSATSYTFDVGQWPPEQSQSQQQQTQERPSWLLVPPLAAAETPSPRVGEQQTASDSALRASLVRPGATVSRRPRAGDSETLLRGLRQQQRGLQQQQLRDGGGNRGYAEIDEAEDDQAAATPSSDPCGSAEVATGKTRTAKQAGRERPKRYRTPRRSKPGARSTAAGRSGSGAEGAGRDEVEEKSVDAAAAAGSSARRLSIRQRRREEQRRTVTPGISSSFHAGTTGAEGVDPGAEQRTQSMANLIRESTSRRLRLRWKGRDTQSDTGLSVAAEAEGLAQLKKSLSLASSESYFEIPATPRRGSFTSPQTAGVAVAPLYTTPGAGSRRKVLRKEREGELYLMIFNACREMYHRLYHKNCIGGSALLSLNTSLDLSNDFAVGKVRQNPIRAWAEVLQEDSGGAAAEDAAAGAERTHRKRPPQTMMTGFEYEWSVLQSRLHCMQQHQGWCGLRPAPFCYGRRIPSAFVRSLLNSGACQSDLEQLLAFVDVHEELLEKGGRNMEQLMGEELLASYNRQILSAKRFVLYIRDCYPDSFRFAICKIAATLLLNLKTKLVKDTAQKGLVLEEDKEKLLRILDEQQFRLSRFRPCFIFIRPQNCVPASVGAGFLTFGTERLPAFSLSSSRQTSSSDSDSSRSSSRQQRPMDSHQHYHSSGSHPKREWDSAPQLQQQMEGQQGHAGALGGAPVAAAKAATCGTAAGAVRPTAACGSRTGGIKGELRSVVGGDVAELDSKGGKPADKYAVTVRREQDGAAGLQQLDKSAAAEESERRSGVAVIRMPEEEHSSGRSSTQNVPSAGTGTLAPKRVSVLKLMDSGRHRAFASSTERQLLEEAAAAIAAEQESHRLSSRVATEQTRADLAAVPSDPLHALHAEDEDAKRPMV